MGPDIQIGRYAARLGERREAVRDIPIIKRVSCTKWSRYSRSSAEVIQPQLMPQLEYCVLLIFSSGRRQEAGWLHFPYLIQVQPTLKSWLTRLLTFGVKTTEDKDIPRWLISSPQFATSEKLQKTENHSING
jgi:hypothetical protein